MSSKGYGALLVDRERDMAAYDRCPAWLRREMQEAVGSWGAKRLLSQAREIQRKSDEPTARRVIVEMMRNHEAEDAYRYYGPSHPEAYSHGRRMRPAPNAVGWPARRRK